MSTENLNVESTVTDDLDAFSAELFGQSKAPEPTEAATSEEEEIEASVTEDIDATEITEEGSQEGDDTPEVEDASEDGEQAEEIAEEPKPKRNRAQERIEELNAKFRETERRLNEALAKLEQKASPANEIVEEVDDVGPSPDDLNEDGTERYPLGEFDPQYIRDQVRFTLEQELKAQEETRAAEEQQRVLEQQQIELQTTWNEKLTPAQERYPDFQEKGQQLIDSFSGLEPAYGEYLTNILMSMDYGPDVLYYLSSNPDEAHKIVNSGASKATIALGRIEAKFAFAEEEKQKARPIVSKAPAPPPHVNKGSAVARTEVPDDTDDLDAFSAKLFKKGRR